LSRFGDTTVAALVSTAEAALEQLPCLAVDLALVDVSLPAMSGIELVSAIHQAYPDLRCIMLSGHHEHDYVRRALAVGAQGYVLKENPLDLIEAVRAVSSGATFLSAELRPQVS
jgi:DNA-binding NarL/FixJ family response regulator